MSQQIVEEMIKSQYFPTPRNIICRLHYRGINDTYIIFNANKTYYFKVYRCGLRTKEEIQAEVKLLLILKAWDIPATQPVMKEDGEYLIPLNSVEGLRYGVLYTSAGKKSPDEVEETDEYNTKLGKYVASIHKAWDSMDYCVHRWDLDIDRFIHKSMDHIRAYRQWYSFDIEFLEDIAGKASERIRNIYSKNKPGYGICHGDIYPGNLRFDSNDNPVLFDFDFCGYGWRIYDISVYINAFSLGWDVSGMKKRKRRKDAFIQGYREKLPLTDSEFDNMYLFAPFRRIFNIGTIYVSMSNTWGDNWVNTNINEDIDLLKKWVDISDF